MSEKRHTVNKFVNYQNIMVRNSLAFDRHNFVPSQEPLIFGFWVMRFASCENIVDFTEENVWEVALPPTPLPPLRVGKSVISVCKKVRNGLQVHFMAVK